MENCGKNVIGQKGCEFRVAQVLFVEIPLSALF